MLKQKLVKEDKSITYSRQLALLNKYYRNFCVVYDELNRISTCGKDSPMVFRLIQTKITQAS